VLLSLGIDISFCDALEDGQLLPTVRINLLIPGKPEYSINRWMSTIYSKNFFSSTNLRHTATIVCNQRFATSGLDAKHRGVRNSKFQIKTSHRQSCPLYASQQINIKDKLWQHHVLDVLALYRKYRGEETVVQ